MAKVQAKRPVFTPDEAMRIASVLGPDGHGIYSNSIATKMGVAQEKIDFFCQRHESGSDHKSTIYVNGGVAKELSGVYSLSLLQSALLDIGGKQGEYFGRGRLAQHAYAEIKRITGEKGVVWIEFDADAEVAG